MSSATAPITPIRFAEALKDLTPSTLHLKVLELRTSIAQLDYSIAELRPFAMAADQDCIDAIAENERVIAGMQERIHLVRAEVEGRGMSWSEFQTREELEAGEPRTNGVDGHMEDRVNVSMAANGHRQRHAAWTDGTFQTGFIRDGEGEMYATAVVRRAGGSLTDVELQRRMQDQLRVLEDDETEGGLHL